MMGCCKSDISFFEKDLRDEWINFEDENSVCFNTAEFETLSDMSTHKECSSEKIKKITVIS